MFFYSLIKNKKLYIGNKGLTKTQAIQRVKNSENIWAITSGHAAMIPMEATGKRPYHDEPHGKYPDFLPHWHTYDHDSKKPATNQSHSFYSY